MLANDKVLNAHSVHVLAWPFKIEDLDKFKQNIEKSDNWETARDFSEGKVCTAEEFMIYQYLSDSARDIFMHRDREICAVYKYKKDKHKNWKYYVEKRDKEFEFPVDGIQLHLYSFGIGILSIQIHNDKYDRIEDIKIINDSVRRVKMPYVDRDSKEMRGPQKIGIRVGENDNSVTNFAMYNDLFWNERETLDFEVLFDCARFLKDILNGEVGCKAEEVTSSISKGIVALAEDRLFEMVVIRNEELSQKIQNKTYDREKMYAVCYMDISEATCKSEDLRNELLKNSLYKRWEEKGTLYCVSEYSMVVVTGEEDVKKDLVVKPFILEYSYFISLVLAQRIGITFFSECAGQIAKCVEEGKISRADSEKLIGLQAQYVVFKNQLLVLEASTQQQGIEIYKLMRKQLLIEEERVILDEQLESLYEITSVSADTKLNTKAFFWAIVAIGIEVLGGIVGIVTQIYEQEGLFWELLKGIAFWRH